MRFSLAALTMACSATSQTLLDDLPPWQKEAQRASSQRYPVDGAKTSAKGDYPCANRSLVNPLAEFLLAETHASAIAHSNFGSEKSLAAIRKRRTVASWESLRDWSREPDIRETDSAIDTEEEEMPSAGTLLSSEESEDNPTMEGGQNETRKARQARKSLSSEETEQKAKTERGQNETRRVRLARKSQSSQESEQESETERGQNGTRRSRTSRKSQSSEESEQKEKTEGDQNETRRERPARKSQSSEESQANNSRELDGGKNSSLILTRLMQEGLSHKPTRDFIAGANRMLSSAIAALENMTIPFARFTEQAAAAKNMSKKPTREATRRLSKAIAAAENKTVPFSHEGEAWKQRVETELQRKRERSNITTQQDGRQMSLKTKDQAERQGKKRWWGRSKGADVNASAEGQMSADNGGRQEKAKQMKQNERSQRHFLTRFVHILIPGPIPLKAKLVLPLVMKLVDHHWSERRKKERSVDMIRPDLVSLNGNFRICIVTTAALPWMTGTAINPVLRAAYLVKAGKPVTLVVPWLHSLDQSLIFPDGLRFKTPLEQESYIRGFVQNRTSDASRRPRGPPADLHVVFYPARYDAVRNSIMPLGDIMHFVPSSGCDVCVLEEPEHLNWYHSGESWRRKFKLVVGVVHTNYKRYAEFYRSKLHQRAVGALNYCMCQAYVDAVIKLSDALQELPNAVTSNVHGVRSDFLEIGHRATWEINVGGVYFLSKAQWHKGYRRLFDLMKFQRDSGEPLTHIDVYGVGKDLVDIKAEAEHMEFDISFHGSVDHASPKLQDHKVFVNPSESEVLSTTIAEALAMRKYVLIKRHPSNSFFEQFSNALFYETPQEFLLQLRYALLTTPAPLTEVERSQLSWDGATDRFLEAITDIIHGDPLPSMRDRATELLHKLIMPPNLFGDMTRWLTGAGPVASQARVRKRKLLGDMDVVRVVEESIKQMPPSKMSKDTWVLSSVLPMLPLYRCSTRTAISVFPMIVANLYLQSELQRSRSRKVFESDEDI